MTYADFIEESRADRSRMLETIQLIESGVLSQGHQSMGGQVVDTTADYLVSLRAAVGDLDKLIADFDAKPRA